MMGRQKTLAGVYGLARQQTRLASHEDETPCLSLMAFSVRENEKLSTLWTQLSWMPQPRMMTLKTMEEREFHLKGKIKCA